MYLLKFILCLLMLWSPLVQPQSWPQKPVRMLVSYPPGGGVDLAARVVSQKLVNEWQQQIIVDNRSGAGGAIAMSLAAKAQPDGYTLIMSAIGPIVINAILDGQTSYDSSKHFAPVALVASTVYVLSLPAGSQITNVNDLIAVAKANPGGLTFASSGRGTGPHLAGELFKHMANVNVTHVAYRGTGPALTDLLGSQITMMFCDTVAAYPHITAGRLRGIAVSANKRWAQMPNIPTVSQAGLPGFAATGWTGLLAPKHTPKGIIKKINQDVVKTLDLADVQTKLAIDHNQWGSNTPDQFTVWIQQETSKWRRVIATANIGPD